MSKLSVSLSHGYFYKDRKQGNIQILADVNLDLGPVLIKRSVRHSFFWSGIFPLKIHVLDIISGS